MRYDIGKLVSKEVVGNQMRVVGESLSLSSARRECGLVAGDQSAARLARVIIGHVGGNVHTVAVAREMVVYSEFTGRFCKGDGVPLNLTNHTSWWSPWGPR